MATREQDVKTLETIYNALSYQETLQKKIKDENQKVLEQQIRNVKNFPDYEPSNFKEMAEKENNEIIEKKKRQIFLIFTIIFKILAIAFVICRLAFGAFGTDNLVVIIVIWIIPTTLSLAFICSKEVWGKDIPNGLLALFILDMIVGLFCLCLSLGDGGNLYAFFRETAFAGAVSAGCALITGRIAYPTLSRYMSKKLEQAIAEAKRKDAEHFAEYERKKAEAEIVIAQQRAALAVDVAAKIAVIKARIASYLQEIEKQQRIVVQTPGLAMEDKNLYTVSTLLRYFQRGKADSIKEAINLFDAEERQKAAYREAAQAAAERNATLNSWIRTQRDALEEMEANQRRHNERMEAEARRAREEIEEALRR